MTGSMADMYFAPTFSRDMVIGTGYDLALKASKQSVAGLEKGAVFTTEVLDNRRDPDAGVPAGAVGRIKNKLEMSTTSQSLLENTGLSVGAALSLNFATAKGSLEAKASKEMCSNRKRATVFCLCSSQVRVVSYSPAALD